MAKKREIKLIIRGDGRQAVRVLRQTDDELEELGRSGRKSGRQIERGMERAERSTRDFDRTLSKVDLAAFGAAAAAAAALASKRLFEIGVSAEETASKFETTFADASDEVDAFLERWANMAGLTNTEGREITATLGTLAQGMNVVGDAGGPVIDRLSELSVGFEQSGEASADFSVAVLQLAGDLASFNNIPIDQALQDIRSGLVGEIEPMRKYGVELNAAAVNQHALELGLADTAEALTNQDELLARLSLAYERAGKQVGDLARTQDSTANTAKRLHAELREQVEVLAVELLPVFNDLTRDLAAFVRENEEAIESSVRLIAGFVVGAFDVMTHALDVALKLFRAGRVALDLFVAQTHEDLASLADFTASLLEKLAMANTAFGAVGQNILPAGTAAALASNLRDTADAFGRVADVRREMTADRIAEQLRDEADAAGEAAGEIGPLGALTGLLAGEQEGLATEAQAAADALREQAAAAANPFERAREGLEKYQAQLDALEGADLDRLAALRRQTEEIRRQLDLYERLVRQIGQGVDPMEVQTPEPPEVDTSQLAGLAGDPEALKERMAQMREELGIFESEARQSMDAIGLAAQSTAGNFASAFRTAFELAGGANAKFFALFKGFAIAEAIASTFMAANRALASAPPPFNFALAASVVAAGLANVAKIASTNPGGASAGAGGGGRSGGASRRGFGGLRDRETPPTSPGRYGRPAPQTPAPQTPALAGGVTGFGGGAALVGERGPELVTLAKGSNVITNENTQKLLGLVASARQGAAAPAPAALARHIQEGVADGIASGLGETTFWRKAMGRGIEEAVRQGAREMDLVARTEASGEQLRIVIENATVRRDAALGAKR